MLRRNAVLLLLPLMGLSAPGCAPMQHMLGQPDAHVAHATLQGLDQKGVNLAFDVVVSNPYDEDMPLLRVEYEVTHAGDVVARGSDFGGAQSVPAHGSATLPVVAHVDFEAMQEKSRKLKPGAVVDYEADLGLSFLAPRVGSLHVPVEHTGSFPIPAVPEVALNSVLWETLAPAEATAVLDLSLSNVNEFAVDLSHITCDLRLGGTAVTAAAMDVTLPLAGGAPDTLKVKLTVRPADLGPDALRMFSGDEATYELSGRMTLGSPYGTLDLPYSGKGKVSFRREQPVAARAGN